MQSAKLLVVACVTALGLVWPLADAAAQEDAKVTREQATKLFREGNYDEAFTKYKALALTAGRADGGDFSSVVFCLQQLGRIDECDAILEEAAALHKDSWPLLEALANTYYDLEHYGFIIAGQFARGRHRDRVADASSALRLTGK